MNRPAAIIGILVLLLTPLIAVQPSAADMQSNSKVPANQWQKLFGEVTTETVSNLVQTSDGGYAFLDCGKSYQQNVLVPSTIYKLDSSGNMQWNKTINLFTASNLIQTSDEGYEIAGEWNTHATTDQVTPTLIKLNAEGETQWYQNTTTILNLVTASPNIQTSDGGYAYFKPSDAYIFPTQTSFPTLVKTDPNNDTQWIENFTYSGPSGANYSGPIVFPFKISSIIETSDGSLACLGIADVYLQPQGLWGYIYLEKTSPFLPPPPQNQLPTPLPSPTPNPTVITANVQILIVTLVVIVAAVSVSLLLFRMYRKTTVLKP